MRTAVILAGGRGVRLYPSTEEVPKPMLNVGGMPLLERVIGLVREAGIGVVHMIVGYRQELIRGYFEDGQRHGLSIRYLENPYIGIKEKSGLSDALLLMEKYIDEPFLTILGDEVYVRGRHRAMVERFDSSPECEAMIGVFSAADPAAIRKNYSVYVRPDGAVHALVEKPEKVDGALLGCGTYLFRPSVFDALRRTELSPRSGRRELADTLRLMADSGKRVSAFEICENYLNINYQEDLRTAEEMLK